MSYLIRDCVNLRELRINLPRILRRIEYGNKKAQAIKVRDKWAVLLGVSEFNAICQASTFLEKKPLEETFIHVTAFKDELAKVMDSASSRRQHFVRCFILVRYGKPLAVLVEAREFWEICRSSI